MGIYKPTAGQLLINGQRFSPSMGGYLGYLPEERGLYKKESVLDIMVYFGQLKGLSKAEARQWSRSYLEKVELSDKANQSLDKLSGGQQQKIQLGVTIMNRPKLLILDEPTKGFDPINRRLMMDIVQQSINDGSTILLVTHQMEEVERLCQRLALLKDGQRRLYGTVEEIRQQYGSSTIVLEFSGQLQENDKLFHIVNQTSNTAELKPIGQTDPQQILAALVKQTKLKIISFAIKQASLDDIFIEIYQDQQSPVPEASHA